MRPCTRASVLSIEVTSDNMGHSECDTSLEIYSKTWWDEPVLALFAVGIARIQAVGSLLISRSPRGSGQIDSIIWISFIGGLA